MSFWGIHTSEKEVESLKKASGRMLNQANTALRWRLKKLNLVKFIKEKENELRKYLIT